MTPMCPLASIFLYLRMKCTVMRIFNGTFCVPNTTFACPLSVSVPKAEYKAVVFIEDGKPVKTMKFGGRTKD
jgi:hypothetical protein